MLASLAIDPSVLLEKNSSLDLDSLSRNWVESRLCVLLDLVDANKNSYFSEAIKALSDSPARTKWIDIYQAAVKRNLIRRVVVTQAPEYPWSDTMVDALISSKKVDVLILEQDRRHRDPSQRVEVLSLDHIHHAKKIADAAKLRGGSQHDKYGDLDQLWQDNFQDEFRYATNIHIVDRWIFSTRRRANQPGFTKFIELAKRHAPAGKKTILNVYTESAGDSGTEREQCNRRAESMVRHQLERNQAKPYPFNEINLYMIPTSSFNSVLGGRHIRFHDILAATPDHGMELFELSRVVYLNFNGELETFPKTERRLIDKAFWLRF